MSAVTGVSGGILATLASAVGRLRTRIEAHQAQMGLAYPWWLPILSFLGTAICLEIGLGQRDAFAPPQPVALAGLVVVAPSIYQLVWHSLACWLHSAVVIAATAWILAVPATGRPTMDFAPMVLVFLVAEVTAKAPWSGAGATLASGVLIVAVAIVGDLPGAWAHLLELLLGANVGFVLYIQMRSLATERLARAREHERATLAERARISREVHDLTAHSLTVTLLHLTGARRLLQEGDLAEADAALSDAEEAGRRAMADIRRTVGSRTTPDDLTSPLPTGADLSGLVEEVRRAGLKVEYDAAALPPLDDTVGLGVYRILQESLANVARHAPGSVAKVSVSLTDGLVRTRVSNRMGARSNGRAVLGTGSGLAGMAARAEQLGGRLSAGPCGTDNEAEWVVDLVLPAGLP